MAGKKSPNVVFSQTPKRSQHSKDKKFPWAWLAVGAAILGSAAAFTANYINKTESMTVPSVATEKASIFDKAGNTIGSTIETGREFCVTNELDGGSFGGDTQILTPQGREGHIHGSYRFYFQAAPSSDICKGYHTALRPIIPQFKGWHDSLIGLFK